MNFRFSPEEETWRQEVREFFAREVTDELLERLQREQGCTNTHSQELYLKMAQKGWLGLAWPKEFGGQARGYAEQAIFAEECTRGRVPPGTVNVIGNTVHFLGGALIQYGTDEQKRTFLPKIAAGEIRSCQGLTEPNAGSDLASVELRAVEDGDDFILNGTKLFSNAHNANHMFTVTRTDPNVPKHRGITLFLTPLDSPGIHISALYTVGGRRRNVVTFEDVRVPKTHMLGELNRGWYNLAVTMGLERSQAQGVAEMERRFADLVEFVKRAQRQGKPLGSFPAVRYALARLATELQTAKLLSYKVVWMQGAGLDVGAKEAPLAKLYHSELVERFASTALDILGQYGQLEG